MRTIESLRGGKFLLVVGEVLLIALGVWLAFGVESWSESRADRLRERAYLEGLSRDFDVMITSLESGDSLLTRGLENITHLSERIESSSVPIPADSVRMGLESVFVSWFFTARDATYTDLVNSGSLDVIQSDSLRLMFGRWESALEYHGGMKQSEVDLGWSTPMIEVFLHDLPFSEIMEEYRGVRLPKRTVDLDAVVRQPEFSGLMALRIVTAADLRAGLRRLHSVASDVRRLADQELATRFP